MLGLIVNLTESHIAATAEDATNALPARFPLGAAFAVMVNVEKFAFCRLTETPRTDAALLG